MLIDRNTIFTREKCPTCGGTGRGPRIVASVYGHSPEYEACPECHGTPPNRWTCDSWRGVVFAMPEPASIPR